MLNLGGPERLGCFVLPKQGSVQMILNLHENNNNNKFFIDC